jgi:hypothetical protein
MNSRFWLILLALIAIVLQATPAIAHAPFDPDNKFDLATSALKAALIVVSIKFALIYSPSRRTKKSYLYLAIIDVALIALSIVAFFSALLPLVVLLIIGMYLINLDAIKGRNVDVEKTVSFSKKVSAAVLSVVTLIIVFFITIIVHSFFTSSESLASRAHRKVVGNKLERSILQGKEIIDEELAELFKPEFEHEYVKIFERQDGERFIAIKGSAPSPHWGEYSDTLRGRNIYIRGWGMDYISIAKPLSNEPYIIEYSVAPAKRYNERMAWQSGEYKFIRINNELNRSFTTIPVYPEKGADCPPIPGIGEIPGALAIGCYREKHIETNYKGESTVRWDYIRFEYVSKDEPEAIFANLRDALISNFSEMGVSLDERSWKGAPYDTGVYRHEITVYDAHSYFKSLDFKEREVEEDSVPTYTKDETIREPIRLVNGKWNLPEDGQVFQIHMYTGREPIIRNYTWIEIRYSINVKANKSKIDSLMRRMEWRKDEEASEKTQ